MSGYCIIDDLKLRCGHHFHWACFDEYDCASPSNRAICPLCRGPTLDPSGALIVDMTNEGGFSGGIDLGAAFDQERWDEAQPDAWRKGQALRTWAGGLGAWARSGRRSRRALRESCESDFWDVQLIVCGDRFTKSQKLASVLLSGVWSTIASALSSPPLASASYNPAFPVAPFQSSGSGVSLLDGDDSAHGGLGAVMTPTVAPAAVKAADEDEDWGWCEHSQHMCVWHRVQVMWLHPAIRSIHALQPGHALTSWLSIHSLNNLSPSVPRSAQEISSWANI
ncbi:hypothetical protein FIBSPDRAFT_965929 [Athelia psychrophila]|uniref:RING-type domain-containing protein n=1 Tax=Athelia psychrophila TaxID=1759441 RepID=A0A167XDA9_9AGAM|nr:hypothetical protein FIBSPDRAFT_965929 [Fibularhizoctonia sp. CBS 109695]